MEQGRAEEEMKQRQDDYQNRRYQPPVQAENLQVHHQPQQPQKCPRCESLNTKFCYYNNYSLSQPRYFCKTCRRYWTHGGTLRNVPVGGGCRKGKRQKTSSCSDAGENSRTQPPRQEEQNLTSPEATASAGNPALRNKEFGNIASPPAIPAINSYYSGGGFLSSLAAMQSMNQTQRFNQQPLNLGGGGGGGSGRLGSIEPSGLALLQGLNVPHFGSRQAQNQQIQHPNELYQMGNRDQNLVQQNRPVGPWNPNLLISSTMNPSNASDASSVNPYPWPDLPGYGPPP